MMVAEETEGAVRRTWRPPPARLGLGPARGMVTLVAVVSTPIAYLLLLPPTFSDLPHTTRTTNVEL